MKLKLIKDLVEILVEDELWAKDYLKKDEMHYLFQKIVSKKEYTVSPTINLVHLDTNKWTNTVMNVFRVSKSWS